MLMSREMDYALRIVRALKDGPMSATQIAESETLTRPITLKVLGRLRQAHIVSSSRGHDGGYSLAQNWRQLTLYDLFEAIGEDLSVNRCQICGYRCDNRPDGCQWHSELDRIQTVLNEELSRHTLDDILKGEIQ